MNGRAILLIDDDPVIRRPVVARLARDGYRTIEACDGARGLELARRNRPALVLLDLAMAPMSGVDFLRALRGDERLKDTPVVVLTAATDPALLAAATELGVEELLIKTRFSLHELASLVASLAGPAAAA
jgi:CheY-like chemotaxis protein